MDSERIAELLRPYASLNQGQLRDTSTYIDILLKWNDRINLTSVRNVYEIVTRHFGESYFAAAHLLKADRVKVVDVGSGAGFPGLPLAIFAPDARVTLAESNSKKAVFLHEVVDRLGLRNVEVWRGRAEDFPEQADLVTMRAVEKFESSLPVAVRLVRTGGRIALMIGRGQERSAREHAPQVRWSEVLAIPGSESRVIMVGSNE